jgi:MazG family protein
VITHLCEKMKRRHEHVFGPVKLTDADQVSANWDKIKSKERAQRGRQTSPSDPEDMPALLRALKIGHRSEKWRFDWETPEQVFAKVNEETAEVLTAIQTDESRHIEEEVGDLLFAVAQWARHLKIDPETALRKANRKFEKRFSNMVEHAALSQEEFRALSLEQKEKLWQATKKRMG